MKHIFALLLLISSSANAITIAKDSKALFALWASLKDPTPGPTQIMGTYQAGCLAGAVKFEADGPGHAVMRPSRNRFYAHPDLYTYLTELGRKVHDLKLPLLLVGDTSPPRGGPMATGHNSHQVGLDADIWLYMSSARPSRAERESWSARSYVINRKRLKSSWSSTQVQLVATAADSPYVNRIFMSPPIKKYFCMHFPNAAWLYKLRPWWGHEEHIHVRLSCPSGEAACGSQPPLNPHNSECGSELDWWFSKEADDEWNRIVSSPSEREFPDLPLGCDRLTGP